MTFGKIKNVMRCGKSIDRNKRPGMNMIDLTHIIAEEMILKTYRQMILLKFI